MMTSLEESRGNELVEIVDGFAKRFGTFRSVFVSAVWADLRAQHASMSTLLPRGAWTVAFLRTANTMLALNEFMAKEMRQVALRDLHTAELEMVLLHFAPLFSVYEQYFEAKKPFAELVRVERQKTPSLECLIAETEVRVGCKFDEMLDLPLLQIIALRVADFLENAQTRINEIEARHASEALIVQIAAAWDVGNHVFAIKRPGRLIVKEGTLIKVSRKKEVAYQFVLFNDALMYGSRGGVMSRKRFKMHNALDLVSVQIGVISVGDTALELDDLSTVAPDGAVGGAVLSMLSSLSEQDQGQLRFNIYSGGGGKKVKPPSEVQVDPALRVALDILQSEVSYLEGLRTLIKVYVRPLLDDFRADARLIGGEVVGIVKQADLSSMFVFLSDIQYIAALSERLLVALREQCFYFDSNGAASGLRGSIADIFLQMSPLFQLYDEYSSSFEFANRTLTEKMHAFHTLREFFDCQERENETQLRAVGAQCMQSLLILPIQRLPRYLLLLDRLRKNTDPDCAEFARLQSAVDAIQAMTCHINERIREREGLVKMHDFVRCWGNVVIRDAPVDRRCLREGSLVKQSRKGFKKYDFVLFTDALMYGERDEFLQRVRHHRTMLIAYCQVREAEDDSCAFELVGREKSFRVRAVDATVCAEWISDLRRAIAAVRERQRGIESETAPVWVKDTAQCMRCEAPFSLVSRPHHCRRCGKCLCNDCTPNRWLLEHIDPHKPQRVCLDCYGNLFAAYGPPALPAAQSKEARVTSPLGVMAQLRSSPLTQEQKE
ncbi:FYVE, RhoGEF and PH domain-containing protein 2 [Hondaea fermentalgiana]|uniref:FYVE, RhoGEF and PH domain-containing protein 2 n=1 Tax=Hondaea fermentalgiana TaxID=2315210 RepID=A0A2R5GIU3_9STRA|nr:FYVE, RhoGEF and PH domain-containing protein 2 [Hondaea fermentalgiana]|eukprot:GBG30525.1 FYVE, RhoGEF and PH domain-containing protein 2 [Hondaea fermentalgiana]